MTNDVLVCIVIGLVVLAAIIAAVAYFAYKFGMGKGEAQILSLTSERDMLSKQLVDNKLLIEDRTNSAKLEFGEQIRSMKEDNEKRVAELKSEAQAERAKLEEQYKAREKAMTEKNEKQLAELKSEAQAEKAKLEEHNRNAIAHLEEQHITREKELTEKHEKQLNYLQKVHDGQLKAFNDQIENSTRELLEKRQQELQAGNSVQMETFLKPFSERLSEMKQAFEENKESNHRNSAAFAEQINAMQEGTQKLGEDAKNLAEALSNNGKVQGDWGEQMLETILQNSGLQEGLNYETQISVADENNQQKRPDVIVHCPDGRDVIIDSKVSLTAYLNYIKAANDEERSAAAKENLKSIKKHIDELIKKDYSKQINNAISTSSAISTVLMFIPNEGSYVLAMESDKNLANDAFKKGVLLLNPTNLMLALNIVSQLWNIQNQEDHCKKIIAHASALYDKFNAFANNFVDIGDRLSKSLESYTTAKKALNEGPGNIVKRLDDLKTLGISVKKDKEIPEKIRE